MRKILYIFLLALLASCVSRNATETRPVISVSIPALGFFVKSIGGDDFSVNIMVPAGTDPHVYEPAPGQVASLSNSVAYISNGSLGFELTWQQRFYEVNPDMKRLNLSKVIDLIESAHQHHDTDAPSHAEPADPHFWVAPRSALRIAESVKSLLCSLNPGRCEYYEKRFASLADSISYLDRRAGELLGGFRGRSFMIFHPSLGYLARDYGIVQIAVESEGKEPNPSSMKEMIDIARDEKIKVIFIQQGFDTKNARSIAGETGAELVLIDPLSENWLASTEDIILKLHGSFLKSGK